MKKTVSVEISGVDFVLNADTYQFLADYLKQIESLFSSLAEKEEIVEDIENRIAEELVKKVKSPKVVSLTILTKILDKIGTPQEIHNILADMEYEKKLAGKPKFYRDPDKAIIAGVCAGIGAYFDVDTVIVRILFILSVLAGGIGLLAYVILWIMVEPAETPAQKMEMYGSKNVLQKIDHGMHGIAKKLKIPNMTRKFEDTIRGAREEDKSG